MKNITPLTTTLIAIWVILIIPFKIIGYGFLPPDDALWHSAKVISGKDWGEVLVLRSDIKIESHPGWHAILGAAHKITKWDVHSLVLFSVISLFIIFAVIPFFFVRYAESWLLALITISIAAPGWIFRLFLGRPYILTMAALLAIFFLWPKLKDKKIRYGILITLTLIIAVSSWVHRTWYILLVPMVALLLAREWRAGIFMAACTVAGIFVGACLVGHPFLFIKQTLLHLALVAGSYDTQDMLVTELRPALADFNIVIVVLGMLGWRFLRGDWEKGTIRSPILIIVISCFFIGFITRRVWMDIGMPALAVWLAVEFEGFFSKKSPVSSWQRLVLISILGATMYLSFTADAGGRWSYWKPLAYLSADDPEQKEWLPGPGGIIYSDDMSVFFKTVYKNPTANWRYILGSEAAIMPEEDLKILRNIEKNMKTYDLFDPWVKKMRPEDRLILKSDREHKPNIPGLEWNYASINTWIGRKPKDIKK